MSGPAAEPGMIDGMLEDKRRFVLSLLLMPPGVGVALYVMGRAFGQTHENALFFGGIWVVLLAALYIGAAILWFFKQSFARRSHLLAIVIGLGFVYVNRREVNDVGGLVVALVGGYMIGAIATLVLVLVIGLVIFGDLERLTKAMDD